MFYASIKNVFFSSKISSPERAEGVTEKNDDFNCLEQNKPHHERNRRVFSKSKNLK